MAPGPVRPEEAGAAGTVAAAHHQEPCPSESRSSASRRSASRPSRVVVIVTAKAPERIARWLYPSLVLLAIVAWLPLGLERFPPITDLPEHEAAIRIVRDLLRGDPATRATWELDTFQSQYLVYHIAGALLALVTGSAVVADRALLAIVAVSYPLAAASLLRALGRDPKLAVFACMPFFSRALTVGFLPFCASVPVAFFTLAVFLRQCRAPSWWRGALLAILGTALFYLHVNAYVVATSACGVMSAIMRFPRERGRVLRFVWAVMRDLAFWGPSAFCALRWSLAGSLEGRGGVLGDNVGRMPLWRSVKALPLWIHDPWPARFDDGAGFLWWLGVLLLLATNLEALWKERRRTVLLLYAPLTVCVTLVLALPFRVGAAGMLNVRLATFVAVALLLPLPPPRGRGGAVALALAAVATIVLSVGSTYHVRAARAAELGDFSSLLDLMTPGQKVTGLHFQPRSDAAYYPPWIHVGGYHVAEHGGVSEWTFAHLSHWSVHERPGVAGPTRPPFWNFAPCLFRNAEDGAWADWVLVEGTMDPFALEPPGPRYQRVASSGRFVLYRRTSETWPGDPALDPGPCSRDADVKARAAGDLGSAGAAPSVTVRDGTASEP
jgi:hypothetical protein